MTDTNDRSGHRLRVRKRIAAEGTGWMSETDLLEALLFGAVARRDTRPIAERLIGRFGSLKAVLAAPFSEISEINGAGESVAALLKTVCAAAGSDIPPYTERRTLRTAREMGEFFVPLFRDETAEAVYAACLDEDGRVLRCARIITGGVSSARFRIRLVTAEVIYSGAKAVVLAHNHPCGTAMPSDEDIVATEQIRINLSANSCTLADHIIVAGNGWCSVLTGSSGTVENG